MRLIARTDSDPGRFPSASERIDDLSDDVTRFAGNACADRDAEKVEDGLLRLLDGRPRKITKAEVHGVLREAPRDQLTCGGRGQGRHHGLLYMVRLLEDGYRYSS